MRAAARLLDLLRAFARTAGWRRRSVCGRGSAGRVTVTAEAAEKRARNSSALRLAKTSWAFMCVAGQDGLL